jgi:hypothetical protein
MLMAGKGRGTIETLPSPNHPVASNTYSSCFLSAEWWYLMN